MTSLRILLRTNKLYRKHGFRRHINTTAATLTEDKVEEIKIPVPWGHIAGKWWGPKNQIPILCVHGWQDNANTFDTLIPLLPPEYGYLAVDLPGHGYSSHFPKGVFTTIHDMVGVLLRVQRHFDWAKVSLMGHSYGAFASFLFSSYYPKAVDFFIALDIPTSVFFRTDEKGFKTYSETIEKMLLHDSLDPETSPKYDKSELLERYVKSHGGSVTTETAEILFERGTQEIDGAYRLRRDVRLKRSLHNYFSWKQHEKMIKSLDCNVLYIKAENSPFYDAKREESLIAAMRESAKIVEYHVLPGTHHFHLNSPEVLAPVISSFVRRRAKGEQ